MVIHVKVQKLDYIILVLKMNDGYTNHIITNNKFQLPDKEFKVVNKPRKTAHCEKPLHCMDTKLIRRKGE